MTHCRKQLGFSFHDSTTVIADFKGGLISSDAGLLPVRELDSRLGWTAAAAACLSDPRDPATTEHDLLTLVRQRLFGMVAGYEDANDHTRLKHDPILKALANRGLDDALASQPTLSRFENWVTAREVAAINRLLVEQFIQRHRKRRLTRLIIDIDPTDDPCHGQQQLSLFNRFYDQRMYFPLLVFERRSGMLLGVRLRAGTVHGSHRVLQLLRPMIRRLREAFPRTEIILRADAGLAVPRLYAFCEREHLGYIFGIPANTIFQEQSDWALSWLSGCFERDGRPHRWFGGFRHQAGTWDRTRHIIYKAEVNADGTHCRFLITNLKGPPRDLWPVYADRGTAETFIDELKNGLKADRLSCSTFVANAFRLVLTACAYNLLRAFRGMLAGTAFEHASIETIRTRLIKIGARVRQTARRIWVHLSSAFPLRDVLAQVMAAIQAVPRASPAGR
jgi:hypothetical protein